MMMRAALLLLLAASTSSASLLRAKEERRLKDSPCGILSSDLQELWKISDEACQEANAQRDDACAEGPVVIPDGDCTTTEECRATGNDLVSCVIVRGLETTSFFTTVCGTIDEVALEYPTGTIQTYSIKAVCAAQDIAEGGF